jgi:L-arabinose isomerase
MADGYGFGGEGDWKTSALVRAMKVMGTGLPGGNSFMEDYTYHFEPGNEMVLGSTYAGNLSKYCQQNQVAKFIHWVLVVKLTRCV